MKQQSQILDHLETCAAGCPPCALGMEVATSSSRPREKSMYSTPSSSSQTEPKDQRCQEQPPLSETQILDVEVLRRKAQLSADSWFTLFRQTFFETEHNTTLFAKLMVLHSVFEQELLSPASKRADDQITTTDSDTVQEMRQLYSQVEELFQILHSSSDDCCQGNEADDEQAAMDATPAWEESYNTLLVFLENCKCFKNMPRLKARLLAQERI